MMERTWRTTCCRRRRAGAQPPLRCTAAPASSGEPADASRRTALRCNSSSWGNCCQAAGRLKVAHCYLRMMLMGRLQVLKAGGLGLHQALRSWCARGAPRACCRV